jgi:hypothetical protein
MGGFARIGRPVGFGGWPIGVQNLYLQLAFRANWDEGEIGTPEGRVRLAAGQAWMDLGTAALIAGWDGVDKSTVSRRLDEFCRLTGVRRERTRMGMIFSIGDGEAGSGFGVRGSAERQRLTTEGTESTEGHGERQETRVKKEKVATATRLQRGRNGDATETQHESVENKEVAADRATETQQRRNADATPAQHSYDKEESKEETKETSTPPTPPAGGVEAAAIEGDGEGAKTTAEPGPGAPGENRATAGALWPQGGSGDDYLTPATLAELWNEAAAVTPGLQRVTVPLSVERTARAEKRLRSLPRREQWVRALSLVVRSMNAGVAGRVTTFDQILRANEAERILEAADEFYDGAGQASLMLTIETGSEFGVGDSGPKNRSSPATSPAERAAGRYRNQEAAQEWLKKNLKQVGKGA